jgi:hypothetical protein
MFVHKKHPDWIRISIRIQQIPQILVHIRIFSPRIPLDFLVSHLISWLNGPDHLKKIK